VTSPFLTPAEAASYLRIVDEAGRPNVRALYKFIDRHATAVRQYRLGSRVRYHVEDIEALAVPVTRGGRRVS
jgi:hypothetical protein